MSQDFTKGKIYKITNDCNNDIYVGSTCNSLVKRFIAHKSHSKEERRLEYPLYKLMNEIGFNRFRIELIEDYSCNDKYQLRQREGHYIRSIGTLNKSIAGGVDGKCYQKQYREENEDYFKDYFKQYYQNNKDKLKNKKVKYITCECGCKVKDISQHLKSLKHKSIIDSFVIIV